MRQTREAEMSVGTDVTMPQARIRISPATYLRFVLTVETALVAVCVMTAWFMAGMHNLPVLQGGAALIAAASVVFVHRALVRPSKTLLLGGFNRHRDVVRQSMRVWVVLLPLLMGLAFVVLDGESAVWAVLGLASAAGLTTLWRSIAASQVSRLIRRGNVGLRVAIAGGGVEAEETLQRLQRMRSEGVQVLGLFDDRELARSPLVQQGVAKLGRISDLPDFLRKHPLDLVIVTMPQSAEERIAQILSELWELPVDIRLTPVRTRLVFRPRTYQWLGDVPMLDLFDRPLRALDVVLKRAFDLCLGSVLLVLLSPVLLLIALAIRLDSAGPVFFRQAREGYASRPFRVWKFRTLDHAKEDAGAVVPVTAGDTRVTRVGRFLRRTSLDELPQLFNVIQGSMSLVGPRPHAVGARNRDMEFAAVVQGYGARHRVNPGITGWAQVRGFRGPVTSPDEIRQRVELDLEYIDRWSLGFDLQILAMTLPTVIRGENAV
ncbi:MAG: undecaprenyl-phosphate glucose phosphotransferase [Roseinatronobacter sp.]